MAITDRFAELRGSLAGKDTGPKKPSAPRERVTPWQYLKEVRAELGKVSWPSRSDVVQGTIRVIVVSVLFAIVLGAVDFGAQRGLNWLLAGPAAPAAAPVDAAATPELPADLEGLVTPTE